MNAMTTCLQKMAFATRAPSWEQNNKIVSTLGRAITRLAGTRRHLPPSEKHGMAPQHGYNSQERQGAPATLEVAKRLCRQGDLRLAIQILGYLCDEASIRGDTRTKALVMNQLGVIRRMQKKYQDASSHLNCALIDFQRMQDSSLVAEGMNNLGMLSLQLYELDRAQDFFDEAHKICQSLQYHSLHGFIFLNKADLYIARGDYAMATQMCIFGLSEVVKAGLTLGLARASFLIGQVLWKCHEIDAATSLCLESIRLYKTLGIPLALANCCSEFSILLLEKGEHGTAKQYHAKAVSNYQRAGLRVPKGD